MQNELQGKRALITGGSRGIGRAIAIGLASHGAAVVIFPGQSLYLGSKGAVEQFVRCLSWELGGRGITVNAISPGPTETDMMQDRSRWKKFPAEQS